MASGARIIGSRQRFALVALAVCLCAAALSVTQAQRDNDQDDFDDAGFDDSGYNSPQNHDAEGSHHNPSNYSPANEDDLDDDDEVDESSQVAKVAGRAGGPQQFYSSADSIMLPLRVQSRRHKRSAASLDEHDVEDRPSKPLVRKRRYSKGYIGPVYTYVKTDKHAHYKWGVKHKVGKHYG